MLGNRKFTVKKRDAGSGLDKFDVAVFTASCDTPETNKRYAESLKLDYPILSDPDRTVARAYGLTTKPKGNPARNTIFISKEGKIAYIDKAVRPGSHAADVAAKLKELGVPAK